MKERAEKLEHWKKMEKTREEKKKEKNELIRRQSSMWVDEKKLEEKLLDAIVNTTPLWVPFASPITLSNNLSKMRLNYIYHVPLEAIRSLMPDSSW